MINEPWLGFQPPGRWLSLTRHAGSISSGFPRIARRPALHYTRNALGNR
jgi:hypothetical protein